MSSFGLYNPAVAGQFDQELRKASLQNIGRRYLFTGNGTADAYDPDGSRTRLGTRFLDSLKQSAPSTVLFKIKMYENEGHVPFPTIYDALQWVYSEEKAKSAGPVSGTPGA